MGATVFTSEVKPVPNDTNSGLIARQSDRFPSIVNPKMVLIPSSYITFDKGTHHAGINFLYLPLSELPPQSSLEPVHQI